MSQVVWSTEFIVKNLDCSPPATTLKYLSIIKKKSLSKDGIKKFNNSGGIPKLLTLIHSLPYTSLSLSVLGNFCIDPDVKQTVIQNDGIPILIKLLSIIKKEEIQNRCCRCLANLADQPSIIELIITSKGHELIAKNLTSDSNLDTKHSAIRALRKLCDSSSHLDLLDKLEIIKHGLKLVNEEKLKLEVLKLFNTITLHLSENTSRKIINVVSELLKHVNHTSSPMRDLAVDSMMNITSKRKSIVFYYEQEKEWLNFLTKHITLHVKKKCKCYLRFNQLLHSLCLLLTKTLLNYESIIEGPVTLLLSLLKSKQFKPFYSTIITSLAYSNVCTGLKEETGLLEDMLKVLTMLLEDFVLKESIQNAITRPKEISSSQLNINSDHKTPISHQKRKISSDDALVEAPPHKQMKLDDEKKKDEAKLPSISILDSIMKQCDRLAPSYVSSSENVTLIKHISMIFFKIALRKPELICDKKTFELLANIISSIPEIRLKPMEILLHLTKVEEVYEKLIQGNFIGIIKKFESDVEAYRSVKGSFDKTANVMGKERMIKMLCEATQEMKIPIFLTISRISWNKEIDETWTKKMKVQLFNFFMYYLKAKSSLHYEEVIDALADYINCPEPYDRSTSVSSSPLCCYKPNFDVTFIVEDSKVSANRKQLGKLNPYFRALLTGHFKESFQNVIELNHISSGAFKCVLHYLYKCPLSCYLSAPIASIFELFEYSDYCLLPELEAQLFPWIYFKIDETNVLDVFERANLYDCLELKKLCLTKILLTHNYNGMKSLAKHKAFFNFFPVLFWEHIG